jgi:periplasmic protein TonB
MKTTNKNLDDIVFDKRNKDYGAYYLRKSYNKNVARALIISVILFLGLVTILVAGIVGPNHELTALTNYEMDSTLVKPPVKDDVPKPPDQPLQEKRVSYAPIKVVIGDTAEEFPDLESLIERTTNKFITDTSDGGLLVDNSKNNKLIDLGGEEPPVIYPEVLPSFNGGEDALYKWLGENIKYPQIAKETNIQGTVILQFVVEKDGSITGIQIMKDIGGGCGEEAVRVVNAMPKWKEGRQNNHPVRAQFVLPIRFVLE